MARHDLRQQFGLVEAALPTPAPMQRNRNDPIELLMARQSRNQQPPQRSCQRMNPIVFIKLNQPPQFALVRAIRISGIEALDGTFRLIATADIAQTFHQKEWRKERRAAAITP